MKKVLLPVLILGFGLILATMSCKSISRRPASSINTLTITNPPKLQAGLDSRGYTFVGYAIHLVGYTGQSIASQCHVPALNGAEYVNDALCGTNPTDIDQVKNSNYYAVPAEAAQVKVPDENHVYVVGSNVDTVGHSELKMKSNFDKYCATLQYVCKTDSGNPFVCIGHKEGNSANCVDVSEVKDSMLNIPIHLNWSTGEDAGDAIAEIRDINITITPILDDDNGGQINIGPSIGSGSAPGSIIPPVESTTP